MAASTEHVELASKDTETPLKDPTEAPDKTGDLHTSDSEPAEPEPEPEPDSGSDEELEPPVPRIRETPEDIQLEAVANTVALHPNRDVLVCGDVDGDVYAYAYSCTEGATRELWSSGHHLKSCRQVRFSADGLKLVSVSRDKSVHLLDAERGQLVTRIRGAHAAPINTLLLVDENILATGDDGGTVKVWDMRKGTAFMDLKQHEDYISDMAVDQNKKILLTTSGDGCLGVFNLRRRRFDLLSEAQRGDLTCVALMRRGRKVVCGSSEGTVYIFNWDGFGATSDRFATGAESVDRILPISDSLMCTASTDGYIRAVSLLPNRVVGCVGQHVGEPIEEIAASWDGRLLVSCAHDQRLKFWDASALPRTPASEYRRRKRKGGRMKSLTKKALGDNDFFSGLLEDKKEEKKNEEEEEEEEEEDSDSGSD
ncbi:WD repeat-containing protein 55 isoform 1-T1 [Menidia menidia]